MIEKVVKKYEGYFLEQVPPNEKYAGYVDIQLGRLRTGVKRLQELRFRQVNLFASNPFREVPELSSLERMILKRMFPILGMDDKDVQCIHHDVGCGTDCWGDPKGSTPELVATRALLLLGNDSADTDKPIHVLVPDRSTRVCLEAMTMLKQDFGGKIVEVRLPWQSVIAREY